MKTSMIVRTTLSVVLLAGAGLMTVACGGSTSTAAVCSLVKGATTATAAASTANAPPGSRH